MGSQELLPAVLGGVRPALGERIEIIGFRPERCFRRSRTCSLGVASLNYLKLRHNQDSERPRGVPCSGLSGTRSKLEQGNAQRRTAIGEIGRHPWASARRAAWLNSESQ